jgi:hypothetical protein
MTKSKMIDELKGFFNGVKMINGTNIANVAWRNEPWMIIENEDTFEDCKKDNFNPILSFRTRDELLEKIK